MRINLSYKKKMIYFIALVIIILFGLYQKNFSAIANLNNQLSSVSSEEVNLSDYSKASDLKNNINKLEEYIGDTDSKPDVVQRKIIEFISRDDNGISLIKVNPIHSVDEEGFRIHSFIFILEGNFHPLMLLLKRLEEDIGITKLVSVEYYTEKNYKLAKKELFLKILFQNYEKL